MKNLKRVERLLLVCGVGLLAFCVAAKLHEVVLSRVSIWRLEHVQQPAPSPVTSAPGMQPAFSRPDFLLWSKIRVKQYEESLSQRLAPPLAVLLIRRIHLEAPVLEGTDDLTLNRGVGHIEGTAYFGQNGNVGIAGHRDGFFRGLKDIKVGDRIDLEEANRHETYVVDHLEIVNPSNVQVLRSNSKPTLTLVTCYPFYYIGSAPQRFIVHATRADLELQRTTSMPRPGLTSDPAGI